MMKALLVTFSHFFCGLTLLLKKCFENIHTILSDQHKQTLVFNIITMIPFFLFLHMIVASAQKDINKTYVPEWQQLECEVSICS